MDFSSAITFFVLSISTLLLILISAKVLRGKNKKLPPIASTIFHQLFHFKRIHDHSTQIFRKHKTFRMLTPYKNDVVFTTNPVNVEYILKTNFKNYGKGSHNYETLKDLFGDGIFAVDGEKWRQQRKLASFDFSTKALRDFGTVVFKSNAAKLAGIMSKRAYSHEAMDMQELLMKSTMDSIFTFAFGVELNSLQGSEEGSRFAEAFDNSSLLIAHRFVDVFWRIKRFLRIGCEAELRDSIKIIDDFVYKLIDNKMRHPSNKENDFQKKDDLLSRFISGMEKDPENMTRNYLRDIVLNFLIAGKDTTAGALSWFIYMLCKQPLVQKKVAQDINKAIKVVDDLNFESFAANLTDEALDKMQYLHAALTETLRLYPSVPWDSKVCFSDDTLPDGFYISEGTVVLYHLYAMGRMKYLWGEDAETFRPERWINSDGFFQPESPFKFTAFQAGPRICLGKEFAYRQMKIFAAVLLHYFEFKLGNENEVVKYTSTLTLHIDGGLHVNAFLRDRRMK